VIINVTTVSEVTVHSFVRTCQGIKGGRWLHNQLTRFTEQVAPKFFSTSTQHVTSHNRIS